MRRRIWLICYRQTTNQPRGYATMGKSNVIELAGRAGSTDPLTELLRSGARQLLHQAIETEVQVLLSAHSGRTLEDGRAGVVRNGCQPEQELQTGIGPVTVKIPKVRAKTGEPVTFRSALVPPYVRKTRSLEAALPWKFWLARRPRVCQPARYRG